MISGIIKVEVSVMNRSRRLRLITLTETLIIPGITKTESNNCLLYIVFNNANRESTNHVFTSPSVCKMPLDILLEIMHCARNLQIIN